jgi:hypothetical protein
MTPLHLHRKESGETKMAWAHVAMIAGGEQRQLERDLDTVAAQRYPFHQISER